MIDRLQFEPKFCVLFFRFGMAYTLNVTDCQLQIFRGKDSRGFDSKIRSVKKALQPEPITFHKFFGTVARAKVPYRWALWHSGNGKFSELTDQQTQNSKSQKLFQPLSTVNTLKRTRTFQILCA